MEALEHHRGVDAAALKGAPQIEEVPPLLALVECAELRAQQLIELEGRHARRPLEPGVVHHDRRADEAELGEVFTRVDLHLQSHSEGWNAFGLEAVCELDATLLQSALRRPEPRVEDTANGIERLADGLCLDLHEVDVFRIASCRVQVELVQRRAATEGQALCDLFECEHVDECSRDDEVLLDLRVL